jgi:hypothetical protein
MRDVIWTLIIVWVIYKIIGAFRSHNVFVYNKHEHYHNKNNNAKEKLSDKKDQEFSDYEEIK